MYNCRSSANWPGDLALSVTYSPGTNSTKGVLYGCSEKICKQVIDHLSSCDYGLYHPLTLPTLFAEIERRRHFDLVNPMVTELMQRARNIATAHPQPGHAETSQPAGVVQEPKDYMQLWFEISCLRNGLQSWRHEVEKMILHCDDLTRARFYTSKNSAESSESTPVNTTLSVDVFSSGDSTDTLIGEIEDLNISGRRIRHRLLEIQDEYDEKIRECGMIIDGMVLAAQLVRLDHLILTETASLKIFDYRSGTTSVNVIHRRTWKYRVPILRSQKPPERTDSRCAPLPC